MAVVFISYRRQDAAGYAGRLREGLERRLGPGQIFRDVDALNPGQDFVDAIQARLGECRALVALIGREWLDARHADGRRRLDDPDDYVRMEIAAALQRPGLLVVPVLVEGAAMPASGALPDPLRTLARRHAITLRDETWDTDMDRLAAALAKACADPGRAQPVARLRLLDRRVVIGVSLLAAALVLRLLIQRGDTDSQGGIGVQAPGVTTAASRGAGPDQSRAVDASGPPVAIAIPRIAEVAHGDVVYTLMSGARVPRGSRSTLQLQFRVANDGAYPVNVWDESFRLAIGDQVLSPTSGLNELGDGHTVRPATITFDIPAATATARLRITLIGQTAELPLDLSPTGGRGQDAASESGNASSRAIVATPVREPRPLVSRDAIDVALLRVVTRRFVNKLRVTVTTRITNRGSNPFYSGSVGLRLAAGDDVLAPVKTPDAIVAGGAAVSADFVFETVPTTEKAVLRATADASTSEVPLTLQTNAGT